MNKNSVRNSFALVKSGTTRIFDGSGFTVATVCYFPSTTFIEKKNSKFLVLLDHGGKFNIPQKKMLEKKGVNAQKGSLMELENYCGCDFIKNGPRRMHLDELVKEGDMIDTTSTNKGKGTAGVMKRHGFHGQGASHGHSLSHRSGGSTGCRQDPGKTMKGRKMAGRMGGETITVQNLVIHSIHENIAVIKGTIPGPKGALIKVKKAVREKK